MWKAKRRFGPEVAGTLVVRRVGSELRADIAGRQVPVRREGTALTFALPGDRGAFEGRFARGERVIVGRWIQPRSVVHGVRFASDVTLTLNRFGQWEGQVEPVADDLTLYLKVERRADGTFGAFMRNPERNLGIFLNPTALVRDGSGLKLMGRRPGAKEDAPVAQGVAAPDGDGFTLNIGRAGGSYDFTREGGNSDFYPRGEAPARYAYRPPLQIDDGWTTATLDDAGIDRKGIEAFVQRIVDTPIDGLRAPQVEAVLVARHGKLVLEEYFHGERRDRPHETRSAGKSIVATLVGAAMHRGVRLSPSSPVYATMNGGREPEGLDPRKRAMTLEHLLTMSSGIFCDDANPDAPGREDTMLDQEDEPDFYRFYMAQPMDRRPGEKSVYCSGDPNLAAGMVARAAHRPALDIFEEAVAGPMRFGRHAWHLDPAGNPYGGGGVRILPRDFLKIGQMMLDGGMWNGKRILDKSFADRAGAPLRDLRNIGYGYLWWNVEYPYKNRTVRAFFAGGNGGQSVMVVPALDLVIAIFAGNYSDGRTTIDIQQGYPPRYILPAVREKGDDPNAPVVPRDYQVVYGRSRG